MRGAKSDENVWSGWVGCVSSVLKQRDVSVKWLRSWIGLRTDMINRFFNQTFVRLLCRLRPLRNRGGRLTNPLSQRCESAEVHADADAPAKTEGGKENEKRKDKRSRIKFIGHSSW